VSDKTEWSTVPRRLGRRAFATLAAASLAAPAVHAAPAAEIRIGFASIGIDNRQFAGGSAAAIAHAEGYVERELKEVPATKVSWFFFKGAGPAVNEAFATEQLDIAIQGDLPEVVGRANGLKTRQLMANGAHAPTYLAVPPDSTIAGVDDLRGKKVALFRGTNNHLAVVKLLAAHHLTERDLQVFNMDEATSSAALVANDIDAAFGNYGTLDLAARKLCKIVYSTKGDNRAFERQATVIAREAFVAANPEITQRVITAFVRAADFASQEKNREALFQIWARSGRTADTYRADFADQTLAYRNSPLIDDFFVEQYRVQAAQAKDYGLIRHPATVDGWFDTSFLHAAVKQLGLAQAWTRYDKDGNKLPAI